VTQLLRVLVPAGANIVEVEAFAGVAAATIQSVMLLCPFASARMGVLAERGFNETALQLVPERSVVDFSSKPSGEGP
ncbi:unnamed protein product, partial [Linum tenue]